jgi:hypothetical protein
MGGRKAEGFLIVGEGIGIVSGDPEGFCAEQGFFGGLFAGGEEAEAQAG